MLVITYQVLSSQIGILMFGYIPAGRIGCISTVFLDLAEQSQELRRLPRQICVSEEVRTLTIVCGMDCYQI